MQSLNTLSNDALMALAGQAPAAAPSPGLGSLSNEELLSQLQPVKRQGGSALGNLAMGAVRGAKDVVDTGAQLLASGFDKMTGGNEGERVKQMNAAGRAGFEREYGDSTAASIGRVGGQLAATAPLTAMAGAGAAAAGAANLGKAIATGGMGGTGLAARATGGAVSGGLTAGAVDTEDAAAGAAMGAALPSVVHGLGRIASAAAGPAVPTAVRDAARAGLDVGYVVPPSQVRPTLLNRTMEGIAGKLTTAQNASARNQEVTNRLAREALGVQELTPEAIGAVRANANAAYGALGAAGTFTTDVPFMARLAKIGERSKAMSGDFPELVNKDIDGLVKAFAEKSSFDAQGGLEAIKRLRAGATANAQAIGDPERKALASVQHKLAGAMEDLIDRNLKRSGNDELLTNFRTARTTLARAYDIERAMNAATGNVDAAKLAQALKKGRPLSGELRQVAEFAGAFPKAVQTPERMGSLPQTSPLDWAGAAITGAAGGGALSLAALAARPAMRAAALSQPVQRGLVANSAPAAVSPQAAGLAGRAGLLFALDPSF